MEGIIKKPVVRIAVIILMLSIGIAFIIDFLAIKNSSSYMTREITEKIKTTAEKNSGIMDGRLNHMVGLTDALLAHIESEFDMEHYKANPDGYITSEVEDEYRFMKSCLETSEYAHSLYVVYNPELTRKPQEAWAAIYDGKIQRIYKDYDKKVSDMDKKNDRKMEYFFNAPEEGRGKWTELYYDDDIHQNVFSYTRSIYKDGKFIGVVGADIMAGDIVDIIESTNCGESGGAALFDVDYSYVTSSENLGAGDRKSFAAALKAHDGKVNGTSSGTFFYNEGGKTYITGYSRLENGWILATVQSQTEACKAVNSITYRLVALGFLLVFLVVAAFAVYTAPFLKKQKSLEWSNEQKDIMITYQSRQAKIGEMVGNISHQWKQPLNAINLIAEDLLDSYRYDELDEPGFDKGVGKIRDITSEMAQTISDFSSFLKPSDKIPEYFDLMECVKSAVALMEDNLEKEGIKIRLSEGKRSQVYGFSNEIAHVIFNVLHNARDAILEAGREERIIDIRINLIGDYTIMKIADSGTGLETKSANKLFEPYFTTKDSEHGTGLGLYISRMIVEQNMHGNIMLVNAKNYSYDFEAGAVCVIRLPGRPVSDEKEEEPNGEKSASEE